MILLFIISRKLLTNERYKCEREFHSVNAERKLDQRFDYVLGSIYGTTTVHTIPCTVRTYVQWWSSQFFFLNLDWKKWSWISQIERWILLAGSCFRGPTCWVVRTVLAESCSLSPAFLVLLNTEHKNSGLSLNRLAFMRALNVLLQVEVKRLKASKNDS